MPYEMKNRFLILGLTGPLGSGCTTTGRFLSGGTQYGKTIRDIMGTQIKESEKFEKRIKRKYKAINDIKKMISNRQSKDLGPYKKAIIPSTEDPLIQKLERRAKSEHQKLKKILRRREVIKALSVFFKTEVFNYKNINEQDIFLFGFNPFIYISFSTIIIKLAIEAFKNDNNKLFYKYFDDKIKNAHTESLKNEYRYLMKVCSFNFDILDSDWQYFIKSNRYIHNRDYAINLEDYPGKYKEFISDIKNLCKNNIFIYYKYFGTIRDIINNIKQPTDSSNEKEYMFAFSEILQDWGDNIRATGNPFAKLSDPKVFKKENLYNLANEINILIKFLRYRIRYVDADFSIMARDENKEKTPSLFILECFRNPFEIDFFRSRYAEFYLLSISAKDKIRQKRVLNFSILRDTRDQGVKIGSGEIYKLDVRKCVLLSDISLINEKGVDEKDKSNLFKFFEKILRYFILIRQPGCITPTDDELYMHLAYSQSLKSTCISRKVGAVIVGPKGYIYGAGWNDVGEGQIGCGLRTKKDILEIDQITTVPSIFNKARFNELIKEENSDYFCYKDIMSKYHVEKKIDKFRDKKACGDKCIDLINAEFGIKRLEYCRALHAEENALLQISKVGGLSVRGGSIYTTTFPCELCAKKIYQTGIRSIYYTEPYPESISEEVFLADGTRNIDLIPFEGVKSHSFYRLYKPIFDKKDLKYFVVEN